MENSKDTLQENNEHSKRVRRVKRTILVSSYILVLLISVLITQGILPLSNEPQRELVSTTSIESWVPQYVLYDPPGNGSHVTLKSNGSGVLKMRVKGESPSLLVSGEINTGLAFSHIQSPENEEVHSVVALLLNQTWEIWRYYHDGEEWLEAHLANYSRSGSGVFRFENLNEKGMWISNRTGISSQYSLERNINQGDTSRVTLECLGTTSAPIGAGYNINLMGTDIRVNISVSLLNYSLLTSYVFNDATDSLNIRIFSDGPIMQISQNTYQTDGVLLWFG